MTTSRKHLLANKNYYLAKYYYQYRLQKGFAGKQPIVIYQMGKVGSTTILTSLQALKLNAPAYQVHVLSAQGIQDMERTYYGDTPRLLRSSLLPETEHVFTSHFLRDRLKRGNLSKRWKIITLTRDPIGRNVSEFFYSVDTTKSDPHLPDFYERYQSGNITTEDLIAKFLERFPLKSDEYEQPLRWFDDEFKKVLSIDIFSIEFPKDKGYQIIQGEDADVLLLKLEKIQETHAEAFREFLDLTDFQLVTANTAREKRYYQPYKQFKDLAGLPPSYVNVAYSSKYVRHFYDEQEINAFRKIWL